MDKWHDILYAHALSDAFISLVGLLRKLNASVWQVDIRFRFVSQLFVVQVFLPPPWKCSFNYSGVPCEEVAFWAKWFLIMITK